MLLFRAVVFFVFFKYAGSVPVLNDRTSGSVVQRNEIGESSASGSLNEPFSVVVVSILGPGSAFVVSGVDGTCPTPPIPNKRHLNQVADEVSHGICQDAGTFLFSISCVGHTIEC